jgi:predicted RNase H-related nuclease YkuK (DUF458 family)
MFRTGSNKPIDFKDIPDAMLNFYNSHKDLGEISIIFGTDSQNFSRTKMVEVIAMICKGRGGIFFYQITTMDLVRNVRQKLHIETQTSLELADKTIELIENDNKYSDMFATCNFAVHVDAGNSERGKTKELIPELVGWVKACGYDCQTKPNSFVASSIADKISK